MSPPDPTGRSWRLGSLLGITCFTFLLGVMFRNAQLVALAEAIFAIVALSWVYSHVLVRGLSCERVTSPQAFEDDEVMVEVRVTNRGWLPAYLLEVQDRFEADAFPNRSGLIQTLSPGQRRSVTFARPCARGRGSFRLGPVVLTITDPMGLFRRKRTFALEDRIVVFPRPLPLQGLAVDSRLRGALAGAQEVSRAGHTTNFFGLREYRPGEPMQRIHWRASARLDRLVVTEFEAPTHTGVTLFLDLDRASHRGLGRGSNVEVAIRLAAAVGKRVLDEGHTVQLIAEGREATFLPPGQGARQVMGVLHTLAHVEARGDVPYLELLRRGTPFLDEGGVVVLLFNNALIEGEELVSLYARWRRRRIQVLGLVIDDRELLERGAWEERVVDGDLVVDVLDRLGVPSAIVRTARDVQEMAV